MTVRSQFDARMKEITQAIVGMPVDRSMEALLNDGFGPTTQFYEEVESLCRQAVAEGWMCSQGEGRLRWGRVCEAADATGGFSVDVVAMEHAHGPHHSHPLGEIVLTMPQTPAARFDSKGSGWSVYPPGSGHYPTVTGGSALILYLLPKGKIAFTK